MPGRRAGAAVRDPDRVSAAQRAMRVVTETDQGLVRLAALARDLLGVDFGVVTLLDDQVEVVAAGSGLPTGTRVPVEQSMCVHLLDEDGPLLVPDVARHARLRDLPVLRELEVRSYAGVPLRSGRLVVGAFCVCGRAVRRWDDGDLRLLSDLGQSAATELRLRAALQDAEDAHRSLEVLLREQKALRRVATAVAQGEPPVDVVARMADEVAALLGVDVTSVVRFQPDGSADVVAGAPPSLALEPEACARALAEMRSTGEPASGGNGVGCCLVAPLHVDGRLFGALIAVGESARPSALPYLCRIADVVAVGVSNAEAHERLLALSRSDPLTGVPNRRVFVERLAEELERAQRHDLTTTLAVFDVDHFKQLNDARGHVVGDQVLRELTARVQSALRTGDLLARLGGDEFALLMPETDYAAASVVIDRVRHLVASVSLAGAPVTVTIGAASVAPGLAGPDEAYGAADAALFRAKVAGRNTAVIDRVM